MPNTVTSPLLSTIDRIIVRAALLLYGVSIPLYGDDRDLLRIFRETFENKKIQAIKEIRSATGYGLKEAKETFEALYAFAEKNSAPREALTAEERDRARSLLSFIIADAQAGNLDRIFDNNVKTLRDLLDK